MSTYTPSLLDLANAQHATHQYKKALASFHRVIEQNPNSVEAFLGRGLCWEALLEPAQALQDFDQALLLDATHHPAWFNRGLIWFKKMDYKKAFENFESAVALQEGIFDYVSFLMMTAFSLKKWSIVVAEASTLLEDNPNDAFALEHLGLALSRLGQHDEAITCFNTILQLDPDDANTHNNLGFELINMERYRDALLFLNHALTVQPSFAFALNNRGFCKFKLGQIKAGLRDVNESHRIDPSNPYVYKNRGIIYHATGRTSEALASFQLAKALGYAEDYDEEVDQWLDRLKG